MTAKRFTLAYEKGNWWAVRDGDIALWKEEVVGLLNELNEKKEELIDALNQRTKQCDALHEENIKVSSLIDEKINYLQKKYDFGQNVYHGCPMHNIMHSINVLKEIKKEMGWE